MKRAGDKAKGPANIEVSEARLHEEIGRLKQIFTALDAAVEEMKRHRSLASPLTRRRATKNL